MPDQDIASTALSTGVTTGLTTLTLFGLLVALTKWIGGNFTKAVESLEKKMDLQKQEHKAEMDASKASQQREIDKIKKDHETCLQQHRDTSIELATLRGRVSALDGQACFKVQTDGKGLHEKP